MAPAETTASLDSVINLSSSNLVWTQGGHIYRWVAGKALKHKTNQQKKQAVDEKNHGEGMITVYDLGFAERLAQSVCGLQVRSGAA